MEKKSGFLTFIAALIPGVGYMYYGLIRKGVEALVIYLLIDPVFNMLGMHWLSVIKIPIWLYTFFDTFNVAGKYNRGEVLQDSGFIIKDNKVDGSDPINNINSQMSKNKWAILAWVLIGIGVLSVLNQLVNQDVFNVVRSIVRNCVIPAIFIVGGIYLLFKSSKSKE